MVRARLVSHNEQAVSGEHYAKRGERAQRLAEREFNLSWATQLREDDNRIVAGRFWAPDHSGETELSVEQRFAETLGWKLGDRIGFDIAGTHKNINAWLERIKALPGWAHPYDLMPGYPPIL